MCRAYFRAHLPFLWVAETQRKGQESDGYHDQAYSELRNWIQEEFLGKEFLCHSIASIDEYFPQLKRKIWGLGFHPRRIEHSELLALSAALTGEVIRNRDEHMVQRGRTQGGNRTLAEHRRLLKLPSSEQQDFLTCSKLRKDQRGAARSLGLCTVSFHVRSSP